MKLLLLLSALLSALTGAGGAARAEQIPVAVSRVAESATVAQVAPVVVAGRLVAGLPRSRTASVQLRPFWRLAAPVPLWLSRRRE